MFNFRFCGEGVKSDITTIDCALRTYSSHMNTTSVERKGEPRWRKEAFETYCPMQDCTSTTVTPCNHISHPKTLP